jgi:hypothetical protein
MTEAGEQAVPPLGVDGHRSREQTAIGYRNLGTDSGDDAACGASGGSAVNSTLCPLYLSDGFEGYLPAILRCFGTGFTLSVAKTKDRGQALADTVE